MTTNEKNKRGINLIYPSFVLKYHEINQVLQVHFVLPSRGYILLSQRGFPSFQNPCNALCSTFITRFKTEVKWGVNINKNKYYFQ